MPSTLTYPGVYVEEVPSGVRTIVGVSTSVAAFVGRAARGPTDEATTVFGFAEYERVFGGLHAACPMSYAVRDFFLNGGTQAVVVRVAAPPAAGGPAKPATAEFDVGFGVADPTPPTPKTVTNLFKLKAAAPGGWGVNLRAQLDVDPVPAGRPAGTMPAFHLSIRDDVPGGATEVFRNLTAAGTRKLADVLKRDSALVRAGTLAGDIATTLPKLATDLVAARTAVTTAAANLAAATTPTAKPGLAKTLADARMALADLTPGDPVTVLETRLAAAGRGLDELLGAGATDADQSVKDQKALKKKLGDDLKTAQATAAGGVADEGEPGYPQYFPDNGPDQKTGVHALDTTDLFNILCLPSFAATDKDVIGRAAVYCERRRAVLLVDPPPSDNAKWANAKAAKAAFLADGGFPGVKSSYAAIYFPRVKYPDPQQDGEVREFPACGMIAGVYAKTDTNRGVWKAPAGVEAGLLGAQELAVKLTDGDNGLLNPLGVNCLRAFPAAGRVVWGARTLRGADVLADDYKYVPVRRLALFLEESLYRGTQWAVFEPNAEPLWAQLRLAVGDFLHGLYRQGAFAGASPATAYRVTCDATTTTPGDVDRGIVNVLVAFAPLKPAEFVVLRVQQLARPAAT